MKKRILKFCLVATLTAFMTVPFSQNIVSAENYNSVSNKADFSSDVIYQIITDRFYDGDTTNNPTGDIFDQSNLRKYGSLSTVVGR